MKRFYRISLIATIALLGGCRLDGDALLGNAPEHEDNRIVESYNVCREKKVVEDTVANAPGCATPAKLEDVLYRFDKEADGTVQVSFLKLWDGTYPKLNRLVYRETEYGNMGKSRDLKCEPAQGSPETRVYVCRLLRRPGEYGNRHLFEQMDLGHDNCPARASYRAVYHDPICNAKNDSYYSLEVYHGHTQLPSLYPVQESVQEGN